jgi:TrmH family RNA methyltransferase
MLLTSPANERLKHARRVRDGREPELIFIEGERLAEECLQAGLALIACFHTPEPSARGQQILTALRARGCPLYAAPETVLATISDTVNSQGLIVLAERPATGLQSLLKAAQPLLVGLDAVQDPGNFGTIVRTAEAAGASGVLALKGSVDAFAPKSLRGAMGSAFRLPVVAGASVSVIQQVQAAGLTVVGTRLDTELSYTEFDWRQPTLVLFGNEARGLRAEVVELCDLCVRIPLQPPVESLNVAAAAAALLFEAARQRRAS